MDAFVEMTGSGTASATPDVVVLDLAVRTPGSSVAAALAAADEGMSAIVSAAREHGVGAADLQTTGASVYPQYDREGVQVTGYQANQSLRVRLRDRAVVGPLIQSCSETVGNALVLDNIAVQIADLTPLMTQARHAAFSDALEKARQYATLADRTLGPVVFVVDSPIGPQPVAPYAGREMMLSAKAGGTAVEMGENSVTSSVTVRWEWH